MIDCKLNNKRVEKFARKFLSEHYDIKYSQYEWKDKKDDFDFVSPDGASALEVTMIISKNYEQAIEYEINKKRGKTVDCSRIKWGRFDEQGNLLMFAGADMEEIRDSIIKAINKKIKKKKSRCNRGIVYDNYELCIYVDDCGLFNDVRDFEFLINIINEDFVKIFIITSSFLFIYQDGIISKV